VLVGEADLSVDLARAPAAIAPSSLVTRVFVPGVEPAFTLTNGALSVQHPDLHRGSEWPSIGRKRGERDSRARPNAAMLVRRCSANLAFTATTATGMSERG
jgi:hypothetical protein